ncbi:MarR family transcriptional regulator [Caldibacillus lycopersici]|uniref:MarR family transcriptional regulator n=1 Tax=Perspicuibacillus lycopersici TaxID=1325689 RepID=A0AAE3LNS6_9BACI|nr:MarR family transcriptional regulator [Perspicuibacillus lycopersici]MCU9614157.1 MarR family transcriptional regulator [Perspicuibacillus lycopersici]
MDQPIERLQIAIETLKRNIDSDIEKLGGSTITKSQLFLLYAINKAGKIRLTKLAELLDVKPSAITVMIDRLEKPGFVKRINDPSDRRSILVELTPLGKKELTTVLENRHKIFHAYISKLSKQEVIILTKLIEKMVNLPKDEPLDQ